jgi:hypothetical protein
MQKETANQLINMYAWGISDGGERVFWTTHLWGAVWSWVVTAEAAAAAAAAAVATGFWSVAAAQGWRRPAPATPSPGPHPRQYRSRSATPVSKPRPPLDPRHSAPSAPDVALQAHTNTIYQVVKRQVSFTEHHQDGAVDN